MDGSRSVRYVRLPGKSALSTSSAPVTRKRSSAARTAFPAAMRSVGVSSTGASIVWVAFCSATGSTTNCLMPLADPEELSAASSRLPTWSGISAVPVKNAIETTICTATRRRLPRVNGQNARIISQTRASPAKRGWSRSRCSDDSPSSITTSATVLQPSAGYVTAR
uniref:Unannotated protein n=1 Tax=freshwater metagenome TaxID=449393 RepID=A0A6J7MMC2_9ZZZZ